MKIEKYEFTKKNNYNIYLSNLHGCSGFKTIYSYIRYGFSDISNNSA